MANAFVIKTAFYILMMDIYLGVDTMDQPDETDLTVCQNSVNVLKALRYMHTGLGLKKRIPNRAENYIYNIIYI